MVNLLKTDFYKLKKSGLLYGMIGYMVLMAFTLPIMLGYFDTSGKEALEFSLKFTGLFIAPLALIFGILITKDFASGYIKDSVSYGYSRSRIFLSNSIVFSSGLIVISLVFPVIFTLVCIVKNGYGDIISYQEIINVISLILVLSLAIFAMGSIAALISFISRNNSILILLIIVVNFINQIGSTATNEVIKGIYEYSIFYQFNLINIESIVNGDIIKVIIISLMTIVLSSLIGIYIFEKRDIK